MKFTRLLGLALAAALTLVAADAAVLKQNADGSLAIVSEVTGVEALRAGGPKPVGGPGAGGSTADFRPGSFLKMGPFAGVVATTGGAVGAWTNTLGYDLICDYAVFDVTTQSTGAANLSVGQTATNVTTSSTNLISATSVASVALIGGTAVKIKVKNAEFITLTGSADTSGLVGNLYVHCFPS